MTIAQEINPQTTVCQDVIFPPSDLCSDEPLLENDLHLRQIILLLTFLDGCGAREMISTRRET